LTFDALAAGALVVAAADAADVEAGALEAAAAELELDDGLDEHPAISAVTATMATPPAAMRARHSLDIRAPAAAAARAPSSLCHERCSLAIAQPDLKSISRKTSWRERTSEFHVVKACCLALQNLREMS
jgi:hypothetical protein